MEAKIFLNCSLKTVYDSKHKKIRVVPVEGQNIPILYVRFSHKQRESLPVGSVFTRDVKLIQPKNKKPYLLASKAKAKQLELFR
jgi:hypothetical protein